MSIKLEEWASLLAKLSETLEQEREYLMKKIPGYYQSLEKAAVGNCRW